MWPPPCSPSAPGPGLLRPHRHAEARARRGPHAGLRAPRDEGRREDARGARGRRARLRHGAREHVPPVPHARARADRAARRAAPLPALGPADHHRLRRLPGLLDGPRHRGRRDQGPRRAVRRRARPARSSRSRRRACASAPTSTARRSSWGPETSMEVQAALGSDIALVFDECTPFHADRDYTARSTERTHRWLDRCLDWHAAARARGPGRLRDRPGRHRGGPAARVGAGGRRARRVRDRDRRLARRGQGADVRGRRVDDRGAAGGQAAPPARDRRGRRPRARRRARDRHVRLRDADADRPPRHGDRARPVEALARRPRQGALEGGRRAAARRLPVPGVRARATRARTCTTCSGPRSRPRCGC